ncbi:MAG TPA: class I SAM-dependent methyltransferase [Thermoleophilaceae bacterium]|nr:class I SAM-dependent methyltransferase [Thermoleophilaceae bacterium]
MSLREYYEERYTLDEAEAARGGEWRALGARGKTDHLLRLADGVRGDSARVLEIGCGDGAILAEIHSRRPGWELAGVEIAEGATALSRARNPGADVRRYDGASLPWDDDAFDLALLSHVLEHVPEPAALLREAARVAPLVAIEVPLEANVSARRASKRAVSEDVGHLQRFGRADVARHAADAGLAVIRDLTDALPRSTHTFFARSTSERVRGSTKWAARSAVHRVAPRVAERIFTVHYACLCRRGTA